MKHILSCDNAPFEKIIYDYKFVRRLRGFLIQVLILLDERKENPNKPNSYTDPHWDYEEIKQIIQILDTARSKDLELDLRTNARVMEIYETAMSHYYSRVMSLYHYYNNTDKMIMACNGKNGSVRTDLLLVTSGPKKRAA